MQYRGRQRSSNRFCAWNEYGLNYDLATGLAFVIGYYDPYAQNYVIKTSSKSNSSWRHGKYSRYKTAGVSLALLIPGFMHAALTEMGLGIILPAGFAASRPPMYWTMGRGQQQGAKVITD